MKRLHHLPGTQYLNVAAAFLKGIAYILNKHTGKSYNPWIYGTGTVERPAIGRTKMFRFDLKWYSIYWSAEKDWTISNSSITLLAYRPMTAQTE